MNVCIMSPQDDNHIIHRVSLKRTRQACGPCRRKKARCPGEKPTCSLCQRLGQECSYGSQSASTKRGRQIQAFSSNDRDSPAEDDQSGPTSARRFQSIEKRLDEISMILKDRLPPTNNVTDTLDEYFPAHDTGIQPNDETLSVDGQAQTELQELISRSPLSPSFIQSEVQTYLNYFHDQPYCIFPKSWLLENAYDLPPEIVFPLVALTRRLSVDTPGMPERNISTGKFCADRAWNILSSKYQDGKTDISFLQGSLLLAQLDFADGNAQRGCSSVAIGLRVIQSSQLNRGQNMDYTYGNEAEARRVVTWAFFMLDRAYNGSRNYSVCLSDNHFTLGFPSVPGQSDQSPRGSLHERSTKQGHKVDQGIFACLIQLYSLWGKATEWVFEPLVTNSLPLWQSGSAIAILESEWMQFETQFADTHRYMNVDFKRRAREDPDSRPYLSTWLCVQFLFHAIQCLIHHPFVMMIKLRQGIENLSATFLQKSFESSLLHSRWIARFVKEMQEVDIKLHDPFFGYLAAIAATIQLEHTGNKNPQIALLVNNEYRVLVDFISELSSQWESTKILVTRVNELAARRQNHGSLFYNQDGFSGALSVMPTPANLPRMSTEDEALMWDILDITSSSSPLDSTKGTRVGASHSTNKTNRSCRRTSGLLSEAAEPQAVTDTVMNSEPSRPANEISDWPFESDANSHAFASGVPDIPDWMIFGDFLTQNL